MKPRCSPRFSFLLSYAALMLLVVSFPSSHQAGQVEETLGGLRLVSVPPSPARPLPLPTPHGSQRRSRKRRRSSGARGTPLGARWRGRRGEGESSPHKCFTFFPDSLTATKEPSGKASDKVFADQPGYQKNVVEWQASGKTQGGVADIQGWGRKEGGVRGEAGGGGGNWDSSPPAVHRSGRGRELLGLNWPIPEERKEPPDKAKEK